MDDAVDDQGWSNHPEMRQRIARAESEFREGRATRTETLEEARRLLDSLKRQPDTATNPTA